TKHGGVPHSPPEQKNLSFGHTPSQPPQRNGSLFVFTHLPSQQERPCEAHTALQSGPPPLPLPPTPPMPPLPTNPPVDGKPPVGGEPPVGGKPPVDTTPPVLTAP